MDGSVEDTVDSSLEETDSEAEDQWPPKNWWLQKTEAYTDTVEHVQVTTRLEEKDDAALASGMSELSVPGAYNEDQDGYCNIM